MISILEYDGSHLAQLQRALAEIGCHSTPACCISDVERAHKIIVPDGASFALAMRSLSERRLIGPLLAAIEGGRPVLAISLGLRLLLNMSYEEGPRTGIGVLQGKAVPFARRFDMTTGNANSRHVGWNMVQGSQDAVRRGILPRGESYYFDHAAYAESMEADDVLGWSRKPAELAAVVRRGNLMATQFIPEQSKIAGKRFLHGFATL